MFFNNLVTNTTRKVKIADGVKKCVFVKNGSQLKINEKTYEEIISKIAVLNFLNYRMGPLVTINCCFNNLSIVIITIIYCLDILSQ